MPRYFIARFVCKQVVLCILSHGFVAQQSRKESLQVYTKLEGQFWDC